MKRREWLCSALLLLTAGVVAAISVACLLLDAHRQSAAPHRKTSFDVSAAHVIALNTSDAHVATLEASLRHFLGLETVVLHTADRGVSAAVPLYTRMLLLQGRHSHAEIGSLAALGCLLSHMAIWRAVADNETVAVFEEDAWLDESSAERLEVLHAEISGRPWDLLLLETGHITSTGAWLHLGTLLTACNHSATVCEWQGSRGYLLTHKGAQTLLRHAEPFIVQTDALFWLVAAFEDGFGMYWTRQSVAHQSMFASASRTWDRCLKCYIPTFPPLVLGMLLLAAIGTAVVPGCCIYYYATAFVLPRRQDGNSSS
jgi:GR25 family glycosyltransferase involved in LPS biosynthesis